VKKPSADMVRPTIKYSGSAHMVICTRMMGISAAIWEMQNAAGWSRPKDLCLVRMERPWKDSVNLGHGDQTVVHGREEECARLAQGHR